MVVKTSKHPNHVQVLQEVFDRLLKFNMKLNPLKCSFGLTPRKFLVYMMTM